MEREDCFEGYTKEGLSGYFVKKKKEYLDGRPIAEDKRCYHYRYWANYYGNTKDFWCRHRKEHMKNFHPSTRFLKK